MVLFSGFLRELRANLPQAWISIIVKPSVRNLVEASPYVNEVLTYDGNASFAGGSFQRLYRALILAKTRLWQRRFDAAIVPRWDVDDYGASQLAYMSGAQRRFAYSERVNTHKARANRGYDRLFTEVVVDRESHHEVQRNFGLLRRLGAEVRDEALELSTRPDDDQFAEDLLASHHLLADGPLVVLGIGARHARKMWPLENFSEIALWLRATCQARVLVVGDENDARLAMALTQLPGAGVVNVAGRTTLRQLAALMRRVNLFVGNDSGPKHLAAAMGVPVVEISWHPRSASPLEQQTALAFAPWGVESRLIQPETAISPCRGSCAADSAHCIAQVTVHSVEHAAMELLRRTS